MLHLFVIVFRVHYRAIESERSGTRRESFSDGSLQLDKYNRLSEIEEYLKKLRDEYPEIVTLIEIGKSHENRSITVVKVNYQLKVKIFQNFGHICLLNLSKRNGQNCSTVYTL